MIRPLLWLPVAALSILPALAQAPDAASLEKDVKKLHAAAGGSYCDNSAGFVDADSFKTWTFTYEPSYDVGNEETVILFRVFCGSGAYNMQHAYYWWRDFEGLQPLAFATPVYDVVYEDEDDTESPVESITITGMGAETLLVNSDFDPETLTVNSTSFWRGIGDASSAGSWLFDDGAFKLTHYEVDASYDGEINPEPLLDYAQ